LVFHSFRKTLITLLEQAGVPENFSCDIVGHEKGTIGYGHYSGGASLDNKKGAIEKVRYPFPHI
jgi:intergrase/recombinase